MPLSSPSGGFDVSSPDEANATYCAFLCDRDGRVISDIAEQLPGSYRSVSAHSLVGLIKAVGLTAFLEAVRTDGAALGWEMRIHYGNFTSSVLLNGSRTPFGILVFATLTPKLAVVQRDRLASSAAGTDSSEKADKNVATKPLSDAIHDLKNPISSILSACEYLGAYSQENLSPEQLQLLTEIATSAEILNQLSDRIAELSSRSRRRGE